MTNFHYVGIDGGQSWEWEHGQLTYQAVSFNGSSRVLVYKADRDDPGEFEFLFVRETNGASAQGVAEGIYKEVIAGESESG